MNNKIESKVFHNQRDNCRNDINNNLIFSKNKIVTVSKIKSKSK